jgi:hypothetical protein
MNWKRKQRKGGLRYNKMGKERLIEFQELQRENKEIRGKINNIFDDLKLKETKKDLWLLVEKLIDNEIKQEDCCNN